MTDHHPHVLPRPAAARPHRRLLAATIVVVLATASWTAAKPVPENLGRELRELVTSAPSARVGVSAAARTLEPRRALLRRDSTGNPMVRLTLDGSRSLESVQQATAALPGVRVIASTSEYRAGAIEAFVPVNQLAAAARLPGVRTVVPAGRAFQKIGATTTHGVQLHRIDRLPRGVDGSGITVGVLSDSFDTSGAKIRARDDVASGDLPGAGNPLGNRREVVVLEDSPGGTDEGRAMLQIVHDSAPKARLGFATANNGEIDFADNIRSLAGLRNAPHAVAGFRAQVIVDDVGYYDEPFFEDGIVAQAVDQVAAAGVAYFSAAGNYPGSQTYDSDLYLVPPTTASRRGTNLDFSQVDPALYAGGFHNFAGPGGLDIAQTIETLDTALIDFQWNEPFDTSPKLGAVVASGKGTVTPAKPSPAFTFKAQAGQPVQIVVDADPSGGKPLGDATLTIFDANGDFVAFQDTGTVPETMTLVPDVSGTYTVVVEGFDGSTGDFVYSVRLADVAVLASDFNLLFFADDGTFLGAFAENNLATNRPIEVGYIGGPGILQLVIARANTPARRARSATHLRYISDGTIVPHEYFKYLSSVIWGHSAARGAMAVGAYADFRPSIPEYFTSPGPVTIYFDTNSRPLRQPEVRPKPDISAMDGANTTFFGSDTDGDGFPNFYGTSAAAPQAAAIGALVLDAAGGPGRLSPDTLRRVLQDSAFPHDLDPFHASATASNRAGAVSVEGFGDDLGLVPDPNTFRVANTGALDVSKLTLDLSNANPTERPPGLVFDERATGGTPLRFGELRGITPAQIKPTFSVPADPPGKPGQWKRLTFAFAAHAFDHKDSFGFTVDRDEAAFASGGNSADLLGASFDLETGQIDRGGATFTATFENGAATTGLFVNQIGHGYTPLDGYGFINADQAVRSASNH